MRILHTSDWHLGRTFHGNSMVSEQHAALAAIVDLVRDEQVDVVVVAGDLYDRQLPPIGAVELLSQALTELHAAGATVVATPGNHDSGRRLSFGGDLLAAAGVHLCGDVVAVGRPVLVPARDGGADLAIYPVPYLEPEVARHQLDAPDRRSHDALLRVALDRARADLQARGRLRSVAVAHAFVAGARPCDSERVLSVGGSDRVGLSALDGFDYVALGHLHRRQVLAGGRIRYSGSPLAYSFSERNDVKGVWLVDLAPDGAVRVDGVDLGVGRPMATLRGPLDALLTDAAHAPLRGHWVQAVLTDQVLPRDAMARLRAVFPYATTLAHEPPVAPGGGTRAYGERMRGRSDLDLIAEFALHVTGAALTGPERRDCADALDAVAGAAA